ncbi:MAG: hypothetical protein MSS28_03640 [Tenericutes bacterium]|nr:hypothetical protein [Mycoplasmatota bacterium]
MINEKIIEIYQKKEKDDEKITNLINDFLTKAHELVTLSNDFYQIEKTIRLNKISLKDYLLNSEICKYLEETNNVFYTLNDLKRYITTYEKVNNMELTSYTMAINLYEELEKIEKLEDRKIEYELENLIPFIKDLENLKSLTSDYQTLYNSCLNNLKIAYLDKGLISQSNYQYLRYILADIFNYYEKGHLKISRD